MSEKARDRAKEDGLRDGKGSQLLSRGIRKVKSVLKKFYQEAVA